MALSTVLANDPNLTASCLNVTYTGLLVEPPSSINSGAPNNVCIFNQRQQRRLSAPAVGQCFCDKPTLGASCDRPALPLAYAPGRATLRAVCGGFSAIGGAIELPDESVVPVNGDGTYLLGASYACKCLDVGKVLRNVNAPRSAFADVYIDRSDVLPGTTSEYVFVPGTTFASQTADVCSSVAGIPPSWIVAQDIEDLLLVWPRSAIVLDMGFIGTQLWWLQRSTLFSLGPAVSAGTPCPATPVCDALNYNNLA